MNNFLYYIFMLAAIVVGFFVIKKVTSCLFKAIVAVVVIGIIIWLYFIRGVYVLYTTSPSRVSETRVS